MSKIYRITQFAAEANRARPLFEMEGPNLEQLKQKADAMGVRLHKSGVCILESLRAVHELVPTTLANMARLGTGKQRRRAKYLLASGRYTGDEQLNNFSGRWEAK